MYYGTIQNEFRLEIESNFISIICDQSKILKQFESYIYNNK